jgi:hypothetical protein
MPNFKINHSILSDLFRINNFELPPQAGLVLIGIRGSLPCDPDNTSFAQEQLLATRDIDHKNLRCTLVQWKPQSGEVAVFAGSTVPSLSNILGFRANPPRKSNCLTPGFYKNYVKGKHRPANQLNWHDGLRQDGQPLAIRRTYNNTTYDNFDTIEISTGCDDNIHAAWTRDVDSGYFSSAGCQVVMGIPLCGKTQATQSDNQGPWKDFKDNVYAIDQAAYPYALFLSSEVLKVSNGKGQQVGAKLKFGSSGELVRQLQSRLIALNLMQGSPDGNFGKGTFNTIKKFQTDHFGLAAVDCVVGPVTGQALGLQWPQVTI